MSINDSTGTELANFPEIYYMIQPIVERTCQMMDDPNQPYPGRALYEAMLDRAYGEMMLNYPELNGDRVLQEQAHPDDPSLYYPSYPGDYGYPYPYYSSYPYPYYSSYPYSSPSYVSPPRRKLLQDLAGILLLKELFRRRSHRIF